MGGRIRRCAAGWLRAISYGAPASITPVVVHMRIPDVGHTRMCNVHRMWTVTWCVGCIVHYSSTPPAINLVQRAAAAGDRVVKHRPPERRRTGLDLFE
jgi:hypothetical protein